MSQKPVPEDAKYRVFAIRFRQALNDKDWNIKQLEDKSQKKFHYNQIWNWTMGEYLPDTHYLPYLAELLGKSIDWLLGLSDSTAVISQIPDKGIDFDIAKEQTISQARQTIWVQLRAGASLHYQGTTSAIQAAIDRNIQIRLLICDYGDPSTIAMVSTRREAKEKRNPENASSDIKATIGILVKNADSLGKLEQLKVRTIAYVPSTIVYLSDHDPKIETGEALVLMSNFREDITKAPMMRVSKAQHKRMFQFFVDDFTRLWRAGDEEDLDQYKDSQGDWETP